MLCKTVAQHQSTFRFPSMSSRVRIVECQVTKRDFQLHNLKALQQQKWENTLWFRKNLKYAMSAQLRPVHQYTQLGWLHPLPGFQLPCFHIFAQDIVLLGVGTKAYSSSDCWGPVGFGISQPRAFSFRPAGRATLSYFCNRHPASFLLLSDLLYF